MTGRGTTRWAPDRRMAAAQKVPVRPLEGRARHDRGGRRGFLLADPAGDRREPGPAVLVGQRVAGAHLLNVRRRVEVVPLRRRPTKPIGEGPHDRGFAGTGHAHDDDGRRRRAQTVALYVCRHRTTRPVPPRRTRSTAFIPAFLSPTRASRVPTAMQRARAPWHARGWSAPRCQGVPRRPRRRRIPPERSPARRRADCA